MDLVVYDDDDRRYVPWLVSITAVVVGALLAAGLTYLLARPSAADEVSGTTSGAAATAPTLEPTAEPTTEPTAEPTPSPEGDAPAQQEGTAPVAACTDALADADAALERSSRLATALAEHTRIVEELLAERVTTQQALDQSLPVLTRGATDRRLFTEELARYRGARQACPPE